MCVSVCVGGPVEEAGALQEVVEGTHLKINPCVHYNMHKNQSRGLHSIV